MSWRSTARLTFSIRVLTTNGFSPDGVTALRPDMFEDFFRLRATGSDGQPMIMDQIGTNCQLQGGNLRIIGLSDLGQAENPDYGHLPRRVLPRGPRQLHRHHLVRR
jgi:hypothetical protein